MAVAREFDERTITPDDLVKLPHSKLLEFKEILPLLASPDSRKSLKLSANSTQLDDGERTYPIENGIPILFPDYLTQHFTGSSLPLKQFSDPRLLYFLLSQLKQGGETNAQSTNFHYQRHLFRLKQFISGCKGSVLDVGCDDVSIGSALLNPSCQYIGLEPFTKGSSAFKVVGVAECLPFQDDSVDNVLFNTSLDHILDYYEAIQEAARVLKPGGTLFICTLIWESNTSLLQDAVHFHHFKDYEISGVLKECAFREIRRKAYDYKGDSHRFGLYLEAQKSAD